MLYKDFYSWYAAFEHQQNHVKYLLENVGYSSGVNYNYRGGKTNKMYSIVEDQAERMEKLKTNYSKLMNTSYILSDIMISLIHSNPLGYRAVKARLKKQDIKKVKGKFTIKKCKEAEQQALEFINDSLRKNNINRFM